MADEPAAPASASVTPAEPARAASAAQPALGATDGGKAERFATIIRTGLSNSALSRDAIAWASLETLLPEVVAALIKEA